VVGTGFGGSAAIGGKASGGAASGGSGAGGVAAGGRSQITAAPGATLVKVDASVHYQTFEGWGTSLCWWANRIGGWATDKRNKFLELIMDPTTGLGYNVFRFNIGGGDNPSHSHMDQYRDMPGFEPTQGTWDWSADARQTAVLSRLVTTGQGIIVEAFSNSPPYWMTKSGCASGSSDGSNNLKDDSYDAFAGYLTDVVKHYRDELGITFRTLEPMNEPNANWWKSNGSQEGCHFSASNQQQIIKAVGAQLKSKGLTDTQVSASDENSMDDAYSIISAYDSTTLGYIAQMNAHSYAGSRRTQLRTLATSKGKRLWQSESGPLNVTLSNNTDAAIFMAGRIIQDLRELQPEAWVDWQTVDTASNWTSFSINDAQQTGAPVKRFYMHAAFSRYIRPGALFVDIDNTNMVAALAADGSSLVIVVRNGDTAKSANFTFDLSSLPSVGASVEVYRTSANEDLVHLSPISVQNWSFTASSAAYSVTTYVVAVTK
jgi:O-glycosyl hydrolase